jgi:adenosylmethionine-8-amino-7-oxononanoate aminotransferase
LKIHQQKWQLIITHGRGVNVCREERKEYLEGLSGLWRSIARLQRIALIECAPAD